LDPQITAARCDDDSGNSPRSIVRESTSTLTRNALVFTSIKGGPVLTRYFAPAWERATLEANELPDLQERDASLIDQTPNEPLTDPNVF
jgi:hypothetical protein